MSVEQAEGATARPYKLFLHATAPDGRFLSGADAFFDVPSGAWQAGEYLGLTADELGGYAAALDRVEAGAAPGRTPPPLTGPNAARVLVEGWIVRPG